MNGGSQLDVLGVGDMVTDAFIRLLEDQAVSFENNQGKWLAMRFATKVPFDHSEVIEGVGNAANASVSFARLGLRSGLVSNVGNDQHGRDMINALHRNSVDSRFVHINTDKISNYHFVLWYKEERTILIKHELYDYHWPRFRDIDIPKWLYFSSIAENGLEYHDHMAEWLDEHKDVKLAFQPGTFQIKAGAERLKQLYRHTEALLVNREEAAQISGGSRDNIHELLDSLHALGPKQIVITDGPKGTYASNGSDRLFMPIYPDPAPPYERTGAGDAFSSTFVAALILGLGFETALKWAPINAMSVVQSVGAQHGLITRAQLENYLKKAPSSYKPKPL